MKNKPVIGISASISFDKDEYFAGFEHVNVSYACVDSIKRANALPMVIPVIDDPEVVSSLVEKLDAVLLSGGHDVNPLLWNEEPYKKLSGILPKRDKFDFLLIKSAYEQKKPIMGICRGCQILNVYFGGSLWQDIDEHVEFYIKHKQQAAYNEATHSIQVEKKSGLYHILGDKVLVNSYHHMAIKNPGAGFEVTARAQDGIIEMIENFSSDSFMFGVQWHPEMLSERNTKMQEPFNYFVSKIS